MTRKRERSGSIGGVIRSLRVARGMTQAELADGAYSVAYVSRIESGTRNPSPAALATFAKRLKVPLRELSEGGTSSLETLQQAEMLARKALDAGNAGLAEDRARQMMVQAKRIASPRHFALAKMLLGEVAHLRGRIDQAMNLFKAAARSESSLRIGERIDLAMRVGRTLRQLGQISASEDYLADAERKFSNGLDSNPADGARLFIQMTAALTELGRGQEARRKAEQAVGLAKRADDPQLIATTLWTTAITVHNLDPGRAISLYRRAAAIYEGLGASRNLPGILNQLGSCALDIEDYDLARTSLERAYQVAPLGGPFQRAQVVQNLARLELETGNVVKAVELAEEACRAFEGQDPQELATTRVILGRSLASIDPSRAEQELQAAVEALHGMGVSRDTGLALKALGEFYESCGRHDDAIAALKRGIAAGTVA